MECAREESVQEGAEEGRGEGGKRRGETKWQYMAQVRTRKGRPKTEKKARRGMRDEGGECIYRQPAGRVLTTEQAREQAKDHSKQSDVQRSCRVSWI